MLFDSIDDSTILVSYEFYKIPSCALQLYFPGGLDDKKKKNLPAMQETSVGSLGWEDPLEKGMAL